MKAVHRLTPQTKLVLNITNKMGHATNQEILNEAKKTIPEITATTIHRITKRLISRGLLAEGPELNGSTMVDANITKHDHFLCKGCNGIKDFVISNNLRQKLASQANVQLTPISLTIFGDCAKCNK